MQFLLVPAAGSTDRTVEICHRFQAEYPEQIRVIEGPTGSKAGDINYAWDKVNTPFVLLLDADESASTAFLSRALGVLKNSPDIGIVQARKVAQDHSETWMSRFISSERRVETWINHQFIHDTLAASHFAGSAAVLRHEVPQDVGKWSTQALTEDIDLTLRLYLQTDWEISYQSQLTVTNLTPSTILDLIRQRRRWARGWVEATWRYTRELIRSRNTLGWKQTAGILWELFSTVGAPLYLVSIAVTIFVFAGLGPSPPLILSLLLALALLPARGLIFLYAAYQDPITPIQMRGSRVVEIVAFAYVWIALLWMIQLHVLYLQLAGATKKWEVTSKE